MKGYNVNLFSRRDQELLDLAVKLVERLDDREWRCHEVARIVGGVLDLEVCDGYYGHVEHSWCWTTSLRAARPLTARIGMPNVLDPYCVGALPQVRLAHSDSALPHVGWAYRPGETRTDVDEQLVAHWVARLLRAA